MTVIEHAFADHHHFVADDFGFADDLPILMTAKDAIKCHGLGGANRWLVPVRAELEPAFLSNCCSACRRRWQAALPDGFH